MTTHPYPHKVVEAVARALLKSGENRGAFGAGGDWDATGYVVRSEFMEHANTALTALWEASRVDTVDQLEALPDEAVINDGYFTQTKDVNQWTGGFHQFANNDQIALPVNVLYWGDAR